VTQKKTCLILTNGRVGTVKPCRALAEALKLESIEVTLKPKFPWLYLPAKLWFFGRYAYKSIDLNDLLKNSPNYIITSGRSTVYAGMYLKNFAQIRNKPMKSIHIMDPKVDPKNFDAVICPDHDQLSGPNVIKCLGTLHNLSDEALNAYEPQLKFPPVPESVEILGVFLGGPSKHFVFDQLVINTIMKYLLKLSENHQLLISPSRRTPQTLIDQLSNQLDDKHYIWTGEGPNPYLDILKQSDKLFVTADSVSMMSEFASLSKPLFIYDLPSKKSSNKLSSLINQLVKHHYAKLYEGKPILETYSKKTLNSMTNLVDPLLNLLGK
tara:strand:- start:2445 stop:3416 length:972 start_codon:yes stop_codon:yes gene_type:complete